MYAALCFKFTADLSGTCVLLLFSDCLYSDVTLSCDNRPHDEIILYSKACDKNDISYCLGEYRFSMFIEHPLCYVLSDAIYCNFPQYTPLLMSIFFSTGADNLFFLMPLLNSMLC